MSGISDVITLRRCYQSTQIWCTDAGDLPFLCGYMYLYLVYKYCSFVVLCGYVYLVYRCRRFAFSMWLHVFGVRMLVVCRLYEVICTCIWCTDAGCLPCVWLHAFGVHMLEVCRLYVVTCTCILFTDRCWRFAVSMWLHLHVFGVQMLEVCRLYVVTCTCMWCTDAGCLPFLCGYIYMYLVYRCWRFAVCMWLHVRVCGVQMLGVCRFYVFTFTYIWCTDAGGLPFLCGFEKSTICGMKKRDDNNVVWVRHSGRTSSDSTGPSKAKEGNYYIYSEASNTNRGDKA